MAMRLRVAERRLEPKGRSSFRRRYATRGVCVPTPWAEAHGYPRCLALRGICTEEDSFGGNWHKCRRCPTEAIAVANS